MYTAYADRPLPSVPRLGTGPLSAKAGWAEALDWLSSALASFAWAAGTAQAALPPTADPFQSFLRCRAAMAELRLIAAQQGAAMRALEAQGSSGALDALRGAFARGHEAVLEMCWVEALAAV